MSNTAYNILEEIFTNRINVLNIAVPVTPVDRSYVPKLCLDKNYDIQLVRESGREDLLVYERKTNTVRPLHESEVISESTPLLDVIEILCEKDHVFVKVKRNVTHLTTRADLDTIPVRIWLYGIISLFEIDLKEVIRSRRVNWEQLITMNRLNYARDLYRLKRDRNEEIDFLGCIQLTDIGTIVTKAWTYFEKYFPPVITKREVKDCFCKTNQLRDALAHGQKLHMDWPEIYRFAKLISFTLKKI
jgi:hypothetical protein